MANSAASGQPNGDAVRYERADFLTVNVYIEGEGDTTIRPSHPEVLKRIERDREQIAELNALIQLEQERLNGRGPEADPDMRIA